MARTAMRDAKPEEGTDLEGVGTSAGGYLTGKPDLESIVGAIKAVEAEFALPASPDNTVLALAEKPFIILER